jgi:TRAP transporter TAXI family solute receptor
MKKGRQLCILVSFVLAAVFLMGAAPEKPKPEKDWPKVVAIGSGTGATYYSIAGGISGISEKYVGVPAIPSKTSGAEETARLMQKGDLQMGFITPDVGYDAVRGQGAFQKTGPVALRVFLQDMPLGYTITTLEGKGIKSPADLKGKAGYTSSRGSPIMRTFWDATMKAYGIKKEDMKASLMFDTADEAQEALVTGKVDFFVNCTAHPAAKWTELAATHPMRIVNVDDAHMKQMMQTTPYMIPMVIPKGTYKDQTADVQVSAFSVIVCVTDKLPDSFVYEVTKALWTNINEFRAYHAGVKAFTTEAVKRVSYIPYHPGAIKYYKEIGVWTGDLDKRQEKLLIDLRAKR